MADDFYNQNIGPLKGSYFGPGVGSFESRQRSSDYFSKSIDPVRESIKKTEERKREAERQRQIIEAENERLRKAAADARTEEEYQKRTDEFINKLTIAQQIEDPVERQSSINELESSLSLPDRLDPKFQAPITLLKKDIDEVKKQTKAQQEAQDSEFEASAKLAISQGRLKQARELANKISNSVTRDAVLSTAAGKKPSPVPGLEKNFNDITSKADTTLSALSKITPRSVAPEPVDTPGSTTVSRELKEAMEAAEKEAKEKNLSPEKIKEEVEKVKADYTKMDPDIAGVEKSTGSSNKQIYLEAENSYRLLFGDEETNKLFNDNPDNMTSDQIRDLLVTVTKDLARIKSQSVLNKKFFKQFVPGEGVLPLPKKPKKPKSKDSKSNTKDPESDTEAETFGGPGFVGQ